MTVKRRARLRYGERPTSLRMVVPTKSELVINLESAREQSLTIALSILSRATRVIE